MGAATTVALEPPPPEPLPPFVPPPAVTPPQLEAETAAQAKRWPELPASSPSVIIGSLGAAFLINLSLQTRMHSIATLVATVIIATLILAEPHRRRLSVYSLIALALGGATVAMLRDSPWVTLPAFAVVLSSLMLAGQDRLPLRSPIVGAVADYLADVVASVHWLVRPLVGLSRFGSANAQVVRGSLLATLVVVPLILLLASADAVFDQLLLSALSDRFWVHVTITAFVLPCTAGLILASRRTDRTPALSPGTKSILSKPASMVEGTIVLSAVAVVLGAWGITQVVVALGGADRLLSTADLTAAQNARQGYFQLVAVAALVVGVMIAVDRYVERSTAAQRLRFAVLTALIGVETIGVVIATYSRLALYIRGFGHTMLRTAAAWLLAWLAVMLVGVVITMNRSASHRAKAAIPLGGWLFLMAGLWVVMFGASNPEAFVASANLDQRAGAGLDSYYLVQELGADAVPAIVERLPNQEADTRADLEEALCRAYGEPQALGLAGWNRSLSQAELAVQTLPCH